MTLVETRPEQFKSLEVTLQDNSIVRAYYVKWSDTFYLKMGSNNLPVVYWRYLN